jgi:hypothetical protein
VKQLNDISFEEVDEEDEEIEDDKNLRRLPKTILTEEVLKEYLGVETEKLMLEHHYWIKDTFLDKIGRMCPNLVELCMRRMKISNYAFTCIMRELKKLEKVDISDCHLILPSGIKVMLDNNNMLYNIQANNCKAAITDEALSKIALLESLTFLDISFAYDVTDEGMSHFKGKSLPINTLILNGLTGISSNGLSDIIICCQESLRIFEAGLMNQDAMNGNFCHALAQCFGLEELDLTGDVNIMDDGMSHLHRGEIKGEGN